MDPSTLLLIAALVACPLAMGAMMWMMNKQMNDRSAGADHGQLEQLRSQEEALRGEIAELEAHKQSLYVDAAVPSEDGQPSQTSISR